MAEIISLKNQRKTIKSAFTRIFNFCTVPNVQLEDVRVRIERAEELMKNYEQIQSKIDELVVGEDEMEIEEDYRANIEEMFFNIKSSYYKLQNVNNEPTVSSPQNDSETTRAINTLVQHQATMSVLMEKFVNNLNTENTSTPNATEQQQSELKLPRIQLPDFDGNLLDWVRFKELFQALVHDKTNISNVEKLEYLHSKLKGEALLIIKHLKPMNSNYEVAWQLLNQKYNNIDKIKRTYMELILDQAAMKSSSIDETKRIYNNINEGFNQRVYNI